jgi:hypothetical protein
VTSQPFRIGVMQLMMELEEMLESARITNTVSAALVMKSDLDAE